MKHPFWNIATLVLTMGTPIFAAPSTNDSFQHVDPAAWSVVQRAVSSYAKLQSYTGTLEKHTVAPIGVRWGESPQRAIIAYKRPNKCSVVIQNEQGIWSSISDGRDIYTTIPTSSNFLKTQASQRRQLWTGAFGWDAQLMSLGTGYFVNLASSTNDKVLHSIILGQPYGKEEKLQTTATLDATKSVNGEAVNTVVISSRRFARQIGEAKARWRSNRLLMAFAKSDGLLRRITMEFAALSGEKPVVTVETHSVTSLNAALPDAMFHFSAPSGGAKAVSSSEKLYPQQEPMFDPRLKVGAEPFAFNTSDLQGREFSLNDYKGRVVLLDFWATWCGPCVGELPETRVVYDKYHAQGFEVVGISLDEKRADLMAFLKKEKLSWPQVFDGKGWDGTLAKQYGVRAIPATFLIGRDGKIAAVDVRGLGLEPTVLQALAQK
ncbi:thiol-disulfide oxidoreductase ResA [Abditibacteriota bacterium]|nr:thiol-disulfide oxidoreductase ResA [Abditibacteriota bacterium]